MPFVIRSSAEMARALDTIDDPNQLRVLFLRRSQLLDDSDGEFDLAEFVTFVIGAASDSAASIEQALGFDPASNFVDGSRIGDPAFWPSWEWTERHPGWVEMAFVLTDDGYGHVLLLPGRPDIDPVLLALCREHA